MRHDSGADTDFGTLEWASDSSERLARDVTIRGIQLHDDSQVLDRICLAEHEFGDLVYG